MRCFRLRWFLSSAIVPGNHGTLLRLDGIDRSQNGAIVKCEVSNAIGKSEETQTLDINCELCKVEISVVVNYALEEGKLSNSVKVVRKLWILAFNF